MKERERERDMRTCMQENLNDMLKIVRIAETCRASLAPLQDFLSFQDPSKTPMRPRSDQPHMTRSLDLVVAPMNPKPTFPCRAKFYSSYRRTWTRALSNEPSVDQSLPPYAALSTPVYSLVTSGAEEATTTMNLVTYASPIAVRPRMFALGLYEGTLSRENMLATGHGTLQARFSVVA